jgi:putative endonuclease
MVNMMKRRSTYDRGKEGEEIAVAHLRSKGLRILETRYRYGRGDIDVVAMDGEVLVFCEVKLRNNQNFGAPEYGVPRRKQAQVRKIATAYLFEHEIRDQVCRFDVVAIEKKGGRMDVRHLVNAFPMVHS